MSYCIDPRPLCWRCGWTAKLKCVEGRGWLCRSCEKAVKEEKG